MMSPYDTADVFVWSPQTKRAFPKEVAYMDDLQKKYGKKETWNYLDQKMQMQLHDDLCRLTDNLIFHRNNQRIRTMNLRARIGKANRTMLSVKKQWQDFGGNRLNDWGKKHILGVGTGKEITVPESPSPPTMAEEGYVEVFGPGKRVPRRVYEAAQEVRYNTWTQEGVFYPRSDASKAADIDPLVPNGIMPRYGIVLVPWDLHEKCLSRNPHAMNKLRELVVI